MIGYLIPRRLEWILDKSNQDAILLRISAPKYVVKLFIPLQKGKHDCLDRYWMYNEQLVWIFAGVSTGPHFR
jgi:hypothetical protein